MSALLQRICPLQFSLLKRIAEQIEPRFLSGELLPAADCDIDIERVNFDGATAAAAFFRGDDGGAGPNARVEHDLAAMRTVLDRIDHKGGRLHRRM